MKNDIKITPVKSRKHKRDFLHFPNNLYKDNPCYVPKLFSSEKQIFKSNYMYNITCDSVFYNAYIGDKIVGRIQGILQKSSNEIRNEKRVRFTRFDTINDIYVCRGLLGAIEDWAKSLKMDTVFGPLSYSDIEPEGVLVEGFDQLSTFFETYNAEYYKTLIEKCGYVKEVDWLEHKISAPSSDKFDPDSVLKYLNSQGNLRAIQEFTTSALVKKYGQEIAQMLDKSYKDLYQTVPLPHKIQKHALKEISQITNPRYVGIVINEKKKLVAFGIAFPSFVKTVQKSKGHLYPKTLITLKQNILHPKSLELGLIGVDPDYRNSEAGALILLNLMKNMKEDGIEFAETNLNLEANSEILNQWKNFDTVQHKRRRCYIKRLH